MSLHALQPHIQMSTRQRRMLVDMGIDVWTSRSFNPQVNEVEAPSDLATAPTDSVVPPSLAEVKARLAEVSGAGGVAMQPTKAEVAKEPPVAKPAVLQADKIHLYFAKKANVLYISEEPITGLSQSFVQDLLLFLNWHITNGEFETTKKPLLSEFQWPVVATSGTPERAIAAFLDKHELTSGQGLGLLSAGAMKVLKPWLPSQLSHFIEVPELAELATNALAKEQLWSELGKLGRS
ncbi:MAG: hypothetical protein QMB25_00285 [Pseudomonadales bacterium]|jgi:hypothetical protein